MSKVCFGVLLAAVAVAVLCLSTSVAAGNCRQFGINIKEGKTVPAPVGQCMQLKCINAKKNQVGATPCAVFRPGPGCHMSNEDLTKRFPDCCSKPVC